MTEIEKRAKEYADNFVVGDSAIIVDLLHKVAEESYIKGATEQREIDLERMIAYVESMPQDVSRQDIIDGIIKAIEE